MTAEQIRNEKAGNSLVKALKKRDFDAYYCASKEEAKEKILSFIKKDDVIGWGGSSTMQALGVMDRIKSGYYPNILNRDDEKDGEKRLELMRKSLLSDVFLTGTNAITESGELLNIDGTGNRVSAIAFGPKTVIVACGMNKITGNIQEAVARARTFAAPINAQRFEISTPCAKTGFCADCLCEDCICNVFVHTRRSKPLGRIKVVLVGENLGF